MPATGHDVQLWVPHDFFDVLCVGLEYRSTRVLLLLLVNVPNPHRLIPENKEMGVTKERVCHEMNVSFETLIVSGVECNRSNETQASALGSNIELNQPHGCTQVNALFYNK